jgi:hypothetical protein
MVFKTKAALASGLNHCGTFSTSSAFASSAVVEAIPNSATTNPRSHIGPKNRLRATLERDFVAQLAQAKASMMTLRLLICFVVLAATAEPLRGFDHVGGLPEAPRSEEWPLSC